MFFLLRTNVDLWESLRQGAVPDFFIAFLLTNAASSAMLKLLFQNK